MVRAHLRKRRGRTAWQIGLMAIGLNESGKAMIDGIPVLWSQHLSIRTYASSGPHTHSVPPSWCCEPVVQRCVRHWNIHFPPSTAMRNHGIWCSADPHSPPLPNAVNRVIETSSQHQVRPLRRAVCFCAALPLTNGCWIENQAWIRGSMNDHSYSSK